MTKKLLSTLLTVILILSLAACGSSDSETKGEAEKNETTAAQETEAPAEPKILRLAESFAYPSLDVHKDYYGWYTSIYGMSETLFRVDDDLSIQPLLAESYEVSDDGLTWTFTLNAKAAFSNGTALTADMVIRNLERAGIENERFAYLQEFGLEADGDQTLKITTPEIYPTMLSDLTSPELGIMDLDATTDFDNAPVCTGPFVIKSFEPEGTVEVAKNESYWNGEVKLDGAIFYYLSDDDSKLMAMQKGDVDGYTSVTAAAKEIFAAEPDNYVLTEIPATRLQFYVLNEHTMDENVRAAVNLAVDCPAIADYLGGTVSPATGPFTTAAPYGQAIKPAPDAAAAQAALEAAGYTQNADGMYEKDGQVLTLNICYYEARSLDSIAVIMQQQLKAVGIDSKLTSEEDPDSTYIATGDFDIALYCMIADKAGDPYYCIDALFRADSRWAIAGFENAECENMINELQYETDVNRRAELANQIVQLVIDENAFGFVGLFNKTTVTAPGVVNIAENCPFDFYAISAETDMP